MGAIEITGVYDVGVREKNKRASPVRALFSLSPAYFSIANNGHELGSVK